MKKIFKVVDFLLTGLLIFATIICMLSIYNYKKTGLSGFGRYTIVQVASPSMTASDILVGDVQLIVKSDSYVVGDIIAYRHNTTIIYHEIIEVTEDDCYITKGSSNIMADQAPVSKAQVIGKRAIKMKLNLLANVWFRLSIIFFVYLIYMGSCAAELIEAIKKPKTKSNKKPKR